jgi:hypothetical protein
MRTRTRTPTTLTLGVLLAALALVGSCGNPARLAYDAPTVADHPRADAASDMHGADVSQPDVHVDAALPDAHADASPPDAPPDMPPPDMPPCNPPMTLCGTSCVSLLNDPNNCGACGYPVVGARSCVQGEPSPGWEPMTTSSAAGAPQNPNLLAAWTGTHFMSVSSDRTAFYDPATDTWTAAPVTPWSLSGSTHLSYSSLPDKNQLLVWNGDVTSNNAYLFDEASQTWINVTPSTPGTNGPPTLFDPTTLYPKAGELDVIFGLASGGVTYQSAWSLTSPATSGNWTSLGTWGGASCPGGCELFPFARAGGQLASLEPNNMTIIAYDGTLWGSLTAPAITGPSGRPFGNKNEFDWVSINDQPDGSATNIFMSGGINGSASVEDTFLYSPATNTATDITSTIDAGTGGLWYRCSTALPSSTDQCTGSSMALWTGRALFHFGGRWVQTGYQVTNYGMMGIPGTTQWANLPTANAPAARSNVGNQLVMGGATPELWTGRVAVVYGGLGDSGQITPATGATYQPEVGCVCPMTDPHNAAWPVCQGVTNIGHPSCDTVAQ